MEFEIRITGRTRELPDPGVVTPEMFLDYYVAASTPFHNLYDVTLELVEKPSEDPEPTVFLNDHCNQACYIEDDIVKCRNIGNEFYRTVDGFPVEAEDGVYVLYDAVFNSPPKGWDDVKRYREYEENALSPWLRSMGFTRLTWKMGEADSFGPLSRVCRMYKDGNVFEFMYG